MTHPITTKAPARVPSFFRMTQTRRVAITGIGVISPLGNSVDIFWDNLTAGRSGIAPLTFFDTEPYHCRFGGEVRGFEPSVHFNNPKDAKRMDRYAQMAMAAAKQAVADSGLDLPGDHPDRIGVLIGSGIGGLKSLEDQHSNLLLKSPSRVSPFLIPMMISNIASGVISMEYGITGPNMSIVTACATSNNNIGEAWRIIRFGDADVILAGGSEASITPTGLAGFGNMRALSTRNDEPEKASRPFDRDRDGFVMGEGAAVVVLEEMERARKRGAVIYGELAGYGATADAYHLTATHPEGLGAARCMRICLNHAGLNPEEVGYVNAHATSTPLGDVCEARAIKSTFPHYNSGLLVSSTKSMTGHLLGAAGGVELAASLLAMRDGIVPPTINLDNIDPECEGLDCVPHTAREAKLDAVMSNSFGFGGHNATLVVKRV